MSGKSESPPVQTAFVSPFLTNFYVPSRCDHSTSTRCLKLRLAISSYPSRSVRIIQQYPDRAVRTSNHGAANVWPIPTDSGVGFAVYNQSIDASIPQFNQTTAHIWPASLFNYSIYVGLQYFCCYFSFSSPCSQSLFSPIQISPYSHARTTLCSFSIYDVANT